jgi:hypothetical protein
MSEPDVRALLLEHDLDRGPTGRREVQRVVTAPHLGAGRHRHNGPVFGTIELGSVLFQVQGGTEGVLEVLPRRGAREKFLTRRALPRRGRPGARRAPLPAHATS